ncbi:uncharacterized protein BO97DRAFT_410544 [Aspergillus homomorphus CBS 101889]|uniref:Uncharacterized protein n=1 Tax=Aspergillus homomorphus (strain CBS 101889) TaxID=1450537 RepID=A0A395IAI5_ASPHC|nr:hypothetical protein BO97DRAFT_410544 [Aspergillus homomorphus CBS 101889]RAL17051.1 hypothetical protein BO97DRAFT_410544 [Aspergillus homomorphus CBS 101889]
MTHRNTIVGHMLTAVLDLEGQKTHGEKEAEEAAIKAHPEQASEIRDHGCHQKSLELVDTVARYLHKAGIPHSWIYCGHRAPVDQWQIYIAFGKEGISDDERAELRQSLLSRYLGDEVHLETDVVIQHAASLPWRAVLRWESNRGWKHTTNLTVSHGRIFVPVRDGQVDVDEHRAFSKAATPRASTESIASIVDSVWGALYGPPNERTELTLDEAIEKMKVLRTS